MDEKRKGPVRRLFGTLWSFVGWLRVSLANLVFLLVLLVLLAMLTLDRRPAVPDGGALVLDPSGRTGSSDDGSLAWQVTVNPGGGYRFTASMRIDGTMQAIRDEAAGS